jgi:asparagine synthase (glutamine-hydrolysing)
MRLICGFVQLDGRPADPALLTRMTDALQRDGIRAAVSRELQGPAAFAVLDFSPASPPGKQGAARIFAGDVRLDDPAGLARQIGRSDLNAPDAVLAATLDKFGPDGLDRVLGDFAFACWDSARNVLTCGRDIFGVRPFAYVHRPRELFAFASFPRGLHGAGILPKRIDERALLREFDFELTNEDCLIAGVNRLPPAHFLQLSPEGLALRRYFEFDRTKLASRRCSPEQAAAELRHLVQQAVLCRLPSSGEAGAHLSGGLDSASIAVIAARELRARDRRLHAFSVLDRQRNDFVLEDETEPVKSVLGQEGSIEWTPVHASLALSAMNGPLDSDTMVGLGPEQPQNAIGIAARSRGIDIVLSGLGGDECASFSGRGLLAHLFWRGRWRRLKQELNALQHRRGWKRWQTFRGDVMFPLLPRFAATLVRKLRDRNPPLEAILRATLSAKARRILGAPREYATGFEPAIGEARWHAINARSITNRAEKLASIGSRHGIAYAFPLLDRRVVEFALSLPHEFFLRDGIGRRVYRDAMAGVLPDSVRLNQEKLEPAPSLSVDVAARTEDLLARIDSLETNTAVSRIFDLGHLREEIARFPDPDELYTRLNEEGRHPDRIRMLGVTRALTIAAYVAQHGGQKTNDHAASPVSSIPSGS